MFLLILPLLLSPLCLWFPSVPGLTPTLALPGPTPTLAPREPTPTLPGPTPTLQGSIPTLQGPTPTLQGPTLTLARALTHARPGLDTSRPRDIPPPDRLVLTQTWT